MCMALFLGSEAKLPIIPFNQDAPAFHTHELTDPDKSVLVHFTLPHVIYIGASSGCGCSFRHATFHKGEWPVYILDDELESIATQNDHQSLYNYLKNSGQTKFEIHACWEDEFDLPVEFHGRLSELEIINPDFYFKERGHYWMATDNGFQSSSDIKHRLS